MWNLGNRSVIALVSVLSGCVFFYNLWGPILILAISLILTVYACYSLIINDSLLSPHAFLLFGYCKHVFLEVYAGLESIVNRVNEYIDQLWETINHRYRELHLTKSKMDRRRRTHYQLSEDSYPTERNSSSFGLISQLSPISKDTHKSSVPNNAANRNKAYHNSSHSLYDHNSLAKHTSTPMFPRNKENQIFEQLSSDQASPKRASSMYRQNHALAREDTTYFASERSQWDTEIDSKVDLNTSEVKAIQAVAGPLLTSSRYNIDQRVYNDVTSPGLSTRLTRYAAEASNKLTHQSQYHIGQFPKVNLHASPIPLINAKSVKPKTPVTVRVAPSHTIRYSPPSKQQIFSNLRHSDNSCSSPSVAQALREISLKRHASREDVALELAKKQRTESAFCKDEKRQKKARDDSWKSEEDTSPQSKSIRPAKRTKTPSCYDIINSLSSSKHVVSGVKRKARDLSRSGTPVFEKHFKSLESIRNNSSPLLSQVHDASPTYQNRDLSEKDDSSVSTSSDKIKKHSPLKGILKTANKNVEISSESRDVYARRLNSCDKKDRPEEPAMSADASKLTHKLFMRAEPERNEKLRMLVEEQGNITAKFTTDDVDEIKREDIADMRQRSMKARLQSMFDAISGKAASQINPDVVIQAEEVNVDKPVDSPPVTCATLNSLTTTTNVNTTPISTSAVAPTFGTNQSKEKSPKHVAFNLPDKEAASNANVPSSNALETQTNVVSSSTADKTNSTTGAIFTAASPIVSQPPASNVNAINPVSTVQKFDFGKPSPSTVTSAPSSALFMPNAVSSNNQTSLPVVSTTNSLFGNVIDNASQSSAVLVTSNTPNTKIQVSSSSTNVSQASENASLKPSIQLGSVNMTTASTCTNIAPTTTTVAQSQEQKIGMTSIITNVNTTPLCTGANNVTTGSTTGTFANISAPLFSFGNKSDNSQTSKPEGFSFGSVGNYPQSTSTFGSLTNIQPIQTTNTSTTAATSASIIPVQNSSVSSIATSSNPLASSITATTATFNSPTSSTFSFRGPNPSAPVSKPGFSFGSISNAPSASVGSSIAPTFSTGNNNNTSTTALPSFGNLPTSGAPQFASNSTSIFGCTPNMTIFGTTTASQPVFGTPTTLNATSTTFAAPKSSATPVFGSNLTTTSSTGFTVTSPASIFTNAAPGASPAVTNVAVPVFGSAANTSAPSITGTSGNLFSGSSSSAPTSAFNATTNIFGQTTPSDGNFKSPTGVFGSNTGAPSLFGSQATTTSTFGATNVPSTSNTPVTLFGTANPSTNAAVPAFTSNNAATPAFGSQNASNPTTSGASASTFGIGGSLFGNNTTTSAVFAPNASSPFGSSASSTFGGQNASGLSAFSTTTTTNANANPITTANNTNTVATFGDSKPPMFGTQLPTFGSSNTAFGTANNATNENNTSGIFTFGANQKQSQQNTTFSFGSNTNTNNNATASTATPFQFGGSAPSNPVTGFNFSAPTSTPSINFGTTSTPTFNASTPAMFSIGSGSTASRSRNSRNRKPR